MKYKLLACILFVQQNIWAPKINPWLLPRETSHIVLSGDPAVLAAVARALCPSDSESDEVKLNCSESDSDYETDHVQKPKRIHILKNSGRYEDCLQKFLEQYPINKEKRSGIECYVCGKCDKPYRETRCSVINHIKSKHLGLTYQCPHCGQPFTQTQTLNRHIREQHQGDRLRLKGNAR